MKINYQLIAQDPLLGKVPDRLIAKKYNTYPQAVQLIRRKFKIKASHVHCKPYSGVNRKISEGILETEVIPLLGKSPDAVIGRKYGVTRERIRQLRKIFDIPVYRKKKLH